MADRWTSPVVDGAADLGTVQLTDVSHVEKWRIWDDLYGVPLGKARAHDGGLVLGVAPGEWIAIGTRPAAGDIVDLTHVRAALRLTGDEAAAVLERVCALDLSEELTPNGSAARTLVAGVATEIVRVDVGEQSSYLLLMSRSFARTVWERLVEVGEPS